MAAKRNRDADIVKHKLDLRVRFKKLVRAVIMNQTWLSDEEEQGISMNVKKNVALMRQKRKPGMLTVADKALLRSNPAFRTIEERKKLCILIAGLNCFSRIPPKIRARMVPVLKFMSINEPRVIIKDGDMPIAVYFILNGEVEMKKNIFNKATKQDDSVAEAIFGPGDCFGDVEMVEECSRMNTYQALSSVEVLSIYDVDYERILKPHMLKQWNEKKLALRAFDYFDFLTPDQIILACKYSYLVQYEPLETIYMGDKDSLGYVRFVLSGECVILQCLSMKVTNAEGEVNYELAEINKDEGLEMFQSWKDVSSRNSFLDIQDILASSTSSEELEGGTKKKQAMRKMGLAEIQKFCGIRTSTTPSRKKPKPRRTLNSAAQARKTQLIQSLRRGTPWLPSVLPFDDDDDDDDHLVEDYLDYGEDIYDDEIDTDDSSYNSSSGSTVSMDRALVQVQLKRHSESTASEKKVSSSSSEIFTASSMINEKSLIDESAKTVKEPVETHFIDVGSLTYGSVFGLGEKMEHRVIMARTVVQCLLLPRFWLLEEEQNPGNIWHRRRFYFECNVPSRQDLFTNFLKTRQWNKFRRDYIESLLNREEKGNITKEEDIPIMCRIVETSDDAS
ncbi:uncharacterized protein LOC6524932 isoform X1 [Drosophila yakuba]|uniref:Cyclic nucleotide-binding domain-containing protein n=2 Tax=Drosophila yakuba TaxID=7245 RepID=B4PXB7_DROYA|nr:uncharacterized protein LOC6524932 isoform X1 [Drosophila yakuba]EDX01880.1 uncharacterized protein Dyak_GE17249 [Drosophila yakuba]